MTAASPAPVHQGDPLHLLLCLAVVRALRDNATIDDETLATLVDQEETQELRKRLVMGLRGAGVISREQCALMFYAYPLRGA